MAVITRTYSTSDIKTGATIEAAHINTDVQALYDLQNANIDNDNIKAAAAIAISKTALGTYTAYATWSPTFDATAALTWNTAASTTLARWTQIGKTVLFNVSRYATVGGAATGLLRITLPVASANAATGAIGGSCYVALDGVRYAGTWYNSSATQILITRHDGTEFSAGTVVEVIINGSYEVA